MFSIFVSVIRPVYNKHRFAYRILLPNITGAVLPNMSDQALKISRTVLPHSQYSFICNVRNMPLLHIWR